MSSIVLAQSGLYSSTIVLALNRGAHMDAFCALVGVTNQEFGEFLSISFPQVQQNELTSKCSLFIFPNSQDGTVKSMRFCISYRIRFSWSASFTCNRFQWTILIASNRSVVRLINPFWSDWGINWTHLLLSSGQLCRNSHQISLRVVIWIRYVSTNPHFHFTLNHFDIYVVPFFSEMDWIL